MGALFDLKSQIPQFSEQDAQAWPWLVGKFAKLSDGTLKLQARPHHPGSSADLKRAFEATIASAQIPPGSAAASLGTSLNLNASLACLRLEDAAVFPRKVHQIVPVAAIAFFAICDICLASLLDWEAAEDFATQALRMGRCSKGFYRRGLARVQLGVAADAKRDFESALEIEPKGEGALMVRAELEKLAAKGAGGTGFEAPEDADYHEAQRFEVANSAREQNGQRQVTWKEWRALQERIAARASHAHAWRKRLTEVTKCLPQDEGGREIALLSVGLLRIRIVKTHWVAQTHCKDALGGADALR
eukprot:s97_g20.t1